MNWRHLILGMLILAAFSGCTGGETEYEAEIEDDNDGAAGYGYEDEEMEEEMEMEGADEAGGTSEVVGVLHAEGRCGTCHDAYATADLPALKAGAFEKFPGHADFCSECHDVQKDCAQTECHPLPEVMQTA